MFIQRNRIKVIVFLAVVSAVSLAAMASASHSWGTYHWGRTANPFALKLGDNVTSLWDSHLALASSDWSLSSVLNTSVVSGSTTAKSCKPKSGRVEVCNSKYGNNGWLGVASIWISGSHITQGVVKVNDTYFNTATYNTPAWRNLVMCQEIGHTLGLDHQDENFTNTPLGTCMDYSNDPNPNRHPNQHDYDMLETIYAHLDTVTTVTQSVSSTAGQDIDHSNLEALGRELRRSEDGRTSLHLRDLGRGEKVFTFVFWAN